MIRPIDPVGYSVPIRFIRTGLASIAPILISVAFRPFEQQANVIGPLGRMQSRWSRHFWIGGIVADREFIRSAVVVDAFPDRSALDSAGVSEVDRRRRFVGFERVRTFEEERSISGPNLEPRAIECGAMSDHVNGWLTLAYRGNRQPVAVKVITRNSWDGRERAHPKNQDPHGCWDPCVSGWRTRVRSEMEHGHAEIR